MTIFWGFLLGVTSSVAASAVWLAALRGLRPRIEISPVIVEDTTRPGRFRIKIINRSRRAVVDMAFELVVMTPEQTKGGTVHIRKIMRLAGPPPLILAGHRRGRDENTFRLRTDTNLREILEQDDRRFVRLRVFGRDVVSGLGGVVERQYHAPMAEVVVGKFAKGSTFEVI